MSASTAVVTPSFAFLLGYEAPVLVLHFSLAAFLQHPEDVFSGAGVCRSPGQPRTAQMVQTGAAVLRSGDLHGDGAEGRRGVPRTEDAFLPEAVPSDGRQDSHRGHARLLQGVMTLGGDGEPAHRAQRLPGEGEPPVGGVDGMVGSGQLLPQLLPGVPNGSRPPARALGLPDVAPHEEIPGAEEERVAPRTFPAVDPAFTEPLSKVSLRLPELGSAAAPRPPPGARRHAGLPPAPQPAPEPAEDAQATPRIGA